jgi:RHS repeat-associated protein
MYWEYCDRFPPIRLHFQAGKWYVPTMIGFQIQGCIRSRFACTFSLSGTQLSVYSGPNSSNPHLPEDANGNVTDLVNTDGNVVGHYEYSPYGEVIPATGAEAQNNKLRFSTKYWDDETHLGYWGYRYFSANLSKWINRDPIGEVGGKNLYIAFKNATINVVDQFGLEPDRITQDEVTYEFPDEETIIVNRSRSIDKGCICGQQRDPSQINGSGSFTETDVYFAWRRGSETADCWVCKRCSQKRTKHWIDQCDLVDYTYANTSNTTVSDAPPVPSDLFPYQPDTKYTITINLSLSIYYFNWVPHKKTDSADPETCSGSYNSNFCGPKPVSGGEGPRG